MDHTRGTICAWRQLLFIPLATNIIMQEQPRWLVPRWDRLFCICMGQACISEAFPWRFVIINNLQFVLLLVSKRQYVTNLNCLNTCICIVIYCVAVRFFDVSIIILQAWTAASVSPRASIVTCLAATARRRPFEHAAPMEARKYLLSPPTT